ncbi:MAG: accessory factor UbiK family protein [Burkholderiales bacterium]
MKVLDGLSRKVDELVANTPIEDVQKNLRALMSSWFSRLDLVSREEFEVQLEVLRRTQHKLEQLEAQIAELEARLNDE